MLLDAFVARAGADRVVDRLALHGVEQDDAGVTVTFRDATGGPARPQRGRRGDRAATACIPSIRKQLHPDEGAPRYSGVNMWRGVTRWKPILTGRSMVRAGWLRPARW